MIIGPDGPIPRTTCSVCGYKLTAAFGIGNAEAPSPGDVSFCAKCGKLTIFDENLSLREPTEAERTEILQDPDVQRARKLNALVVNPIWNREGDS